MNWLNPYLLGISFGEVILWAALLAFFVFWICYWRLIDNYMVVKMQNHARQHVETEIAARIMGYITNLFSAFLLLPASRTGLMVEVVPKYNTEKKIK